MKSTCLILFLGFIIISCEEVKKNPCERFYDFTKIDNKITSKEFSGYYEIDSISEKTLKTKFGKPSITLYYSDSSNQGLIIIRNLPDPYTPYNFLINGDSIFYGKWNAAGGRSGGGERVISIEYKKDLDYSFYGHTHTSLLARYEKNNLPILGVRKALQGCNLTFRLVRKEIWQKDISPFLYFHDTLDIAGLNRYYLNKYLP